MKQVTRKFAVPATSTREFRLQVQKAINGAKKDPEIKKIHNYGEKLREERGLDNDWDLAHKIVEAKTPFRLGVSQEHSDKGIPGKTHGCSIYLAAIAAGFKEVLIRPSTSYFLMRDNTIAKYRNPPKTKAVVDDLDHGRRVHPGVLHFVPIPPSQHRANAQKTAKDNRATSSRAKQIKRSLSMERRGRPLGSSNKTDRDLW